MAFPVLESFTEGVGSSDTTAQTIPLPSGITSGDYLLMVLAVDDPGLLTGVDQGWSQDGFDVAGAFFDGYICSKVAGASEVNPIVSYSSATRATYKVFRISGSNNSVLETSVIKLGSGDADVDFNSLSPTADALLLKVPLWNATTTISSGPTTGTAVGTDIRSSASIHAYQQNVSSGATTADNITLSSGQRSCGYAIAIEEASASLEIDSSPASLERGGSAANIVVSNPGTAPTSGNTTVRFTDASGPTLTKGTITGSDPYTIPVSVPLTAAIQNQTGLAFHVDINGETISGGSCELIEEAGYDDTYLSSPNTASDTSILYGYTGDTPVTGDQVIFEALVLGTVDGTPGQPITVTVAANGIVTFDGGGVITGTVAVDRYVIQADGTIGTNADYTYDFGLSNNVPTGQPLVTGTVQEDHTLTADPGTLADADGIASIAYQWQRDGADISGATSTTYLLTQVDVGAVIRVGAVITDNNSNVESVIYSAGTSPVLNVNDSPTGVPLISGSPTEDATLTALPGTLADEDGLGVLSYQWQRDQIDIPGATNSTLLLDQTDVGSAIRVGVSYTDAQGTAEGPVYSAEASLVQNVNDPAVGVPTLSGTEEVGHTLTADTAGISDPDGLGTFSYQWQRDQVNIAGATGSTYDLVTADEATLIRVGVSFTDAQGTAEGPLYSAETGAIAPSPNSVATGQPAITGLAQENQILTANLDTVSDPDGIDTNTVVWQWLADDVPLVGETSSAIVLNQTHVGKVIKVQVNFDDNSGNSEGPLVSAGTSSVVNVDDLAMGTPTVSCIPAPGQMLIANTGALTDRDGIASISYQWQKDQVDISGATASTYTIAQSDVGSVIRVGVMVTDNFGAQSPVIYSAETIAVSSV